MNLKNEQVDQLRELGLRLIDQNSAKILIPAQKQEPGFWFGGGNIIQEKNGRILICGRYRNAGDSTTGTGAGERGLEFSIFAGESTNADFSKILSFSKQDLAHSSEIVSIEGGCLLQNTQSDKIELFISTEKKIAYPKALINFQKPGTGVWTVDLLQGTKAESIDLNSIQTVASSGNGNTLHVKDPVAFNSSNGDTELIYTAIIHFLGPVQTPASHAERKMKIHLNTLVTPF